MTTRTRKDRKDVHKRTRISLQSENAKKYLTNAILCQLREEREYYAMISKEYLAEADSWIEKFSNYPEIEFILVFEHNDFMVDVLTRDKDYIETVVYPKKRRGRSLLSHDTFRSKRISVYISNEELEKLEKSAKRENMPIPDFLRAIGLNHKIPQKPATLDLQAYSELSRSASNLNQIAKHLNSCPDAIIDLDITIKALKDFRRSLIGARIEDCNES